MQPMPAAYFGTEMDDRWWRRYKHNGFFMRGNGTFWLDEEGIRFHHFLAVKHLLIPYGGVKGVAVGSWHAGRWGAGKQVLKIRWEAEGARLCSGFIVGGTPAQTTQIQLALQTQLRLHGASTPL